MHTAQNDSSQRQLYIRALTRKIKGISLEFNERQKETLVPFEAVGLAMQAMALVGTYQQKVYILVIMIKFGKLSCMNQTK